MDNGKIRELLLEMCEELLDEEDIVALVGKGGSKKGRVTRVASQEGVKVYGVPIGTVITEGMREAAKLKLPAAKPEGGVKPTPGLPTVPKIPGVPAPAKATAKPKGKQDVASQFNADPNLKMEGVHTHPGAPGARVYQFSDGTVVFEDAKGTRSKRQKADLKVLKSKGWNIQEIKNGETDTQGGSGKPGAHARLSTDKPNSYENSTRTLEVLAGKNKYTPQQKAAVKKFEADSAQINDFLRKGKKDIGEYTETVSDLRDLLDNSKTSKPVTVYRGMSFNSPEERDAFISNALKPGTSFKDKGFTVASANVDKAKLHADNDNPDNPGLMLNIAVPKESRAASLNAVSGKDNQDQDVLLADGAKYKVDSVSRDASGRPSAELTYIDPVKPASERRVDEESVAITDEQKEAAKAKRFSWSPTEIQLDQPIDIEAALQPVVAAPGSPKPVKAVGAPGVPAKATPAKVAAPAVEKPNTAPKAVAPEAIKQAEMSTGKKQVPKQEDKNIVSEPPKRMTVTNVSPLGDLTKPMTKEEAKESKFKGPPTPIASTPAPAKGKAQPTFDEVSKAVETGKTLLPPDSNGRQKVISSPELLDVAQRGMNYDNHEVTMADGSKKKLSVVVTDVHRHNPPFDMNATREEMLAQKENFEIVGDIRDEEGAKVGKFKRIFKQKKAGTWEVTNDLFELNKPVQGQGFSSAWSKKVNEWYEDNGVESINLHANISVGGYAFARQGYGWNHESSEFESQEIMNGGMLQKVNTLDYLVKRLDEAHVSHKYRDDFAKAAGDAQLNSIKDRLKLGPADPNFPSPYELSSVGYTEGEKEWPGKTAMMGSMWPGKKNLKDINRVQSAFQAWEQAHKDDFAYNKKSAESLDKDYSNHHGTVDATPEQVTDFVAKAEGREVHVSASLAPPGTDIRFGLKGTDVTVRGVKVLGVDDLPPKVYHVTTNLPAVQESGYLRAAGVGGLGGDDKDRIVSMTVSDTIAKQLVEDMKFAGELARAYPDTEANSSERIEANKQVLKQLTEVARDDGWKFSDGERLIGIDAVLGGYSAKDLLDQFYSARQFRGGKANPLFFTDLEGLRSIDPDKVGLVEIPRENLDTGALIVDFDIGEDSLDEARIYGDVPLVKPTKVSKTPGGGESDDGLKSTVGTGERTSSKSDESKYIRSEDETQESVELTKRVRTPAGAKKYGEPIGSVITSDMEAHAKTKTPPTKAPTAKSGKASGTGASATVTIDGKQYKTGDNIIVNGKEHHIADISTDKVTVRPGPAPKAPDISADKVTSAPKKRTPKKTKEEPVISEKAKSDADMGTVEGGSQTPQEVKQWSAQQQFPKPKDFEKQALRHYSSKSYTDVNQRLRDGNGELPEGEWGQMVWDMDQYMKKSRTKTPVVVSRKVGSWMFGDKDPISLKGTIFRDDGYTSTTALVSGPRDGESKRWKAMDVTMTIKVPAGAKAAYMEDLTAVKGQYELLLARGTNFKVNDVRKGSDGKWTMEMEVIL